MWVWYRDAANIPSPPARISLYTLMTERAELYVHIPPPGQPITMEMSHFPVDDNIPAEEDISEALLQLRPHRAGGPSSMRAKHLRMWLRAETREERSNPESWEKVVTII